MAALLLMEGQGECLGGPHYHKWIEQFLFRSRNMFEVGCLAFRAGKVVSQLPRRGSYATSQQESRAALQP